MSRQSAPTRGELFALTAFFFLCLMGVGYLVASLIGLVEFRGVFL
ncbi:hypothetical protein CTTA_4453 [Comamonas testosteroni]|uniref:Uncharacterized protein n=1 Tax=Comamonas testosteroni TaxID=285 RepID=A0A5A7MHX4_COMTE|nr:hypothetical protein [Comamonas testosteroni]GEQ77448.1 hypothetical protein CTTA_4453 [Comamonas testosteroni]